MNGQLFFQKARRPFWSPQKRAVELVSTPVWARAISWVKILYFPPLYLSPTAYGPGLDSPPPSFEPTAQTSRCPLSSSPTLPSQRVSPYVSGVRCRGAACVSCRWRERKGNEAQPPAGEEKTIPGSETGIWEGKHCQVASALLRSAGATVFSLKSWITGAGHTWLLTELQVSPFHKHLCSLGAGCVHPKACCHTEILAQLPETLQPH